MKSELLGKAPLAVALLLVVVVDVIKKTGFLFLILLTIVKNALAQVLENGRTSVKTVFNFYHQNSDDGKQVYDDSGREEANVIEPMFFVAHQIDEHTTLTADFVFDLWAAASDTKLDANTGASGGEGRKEQTRVSGSLGANKEKGNWSYGGKFGFSSEYDYKSLNASFNIARAFAQKNFTLGLGAQYYADSVSLFKDVTPADEAVLSEDLDRNILAINLSASQILTKRDIIEFGASFVRAEKNLESTASFVSIDGVREAEEMPETRSRYALSTKWVHGLSSSSALNTSYRYYFDQWDLTAHTLKLAYLFETNEEDEDFIEVSLRIHTQSDVNFYADSFNERQDFMTSDSDLDRFNSAELGLFYRDYQGDKNWFGLKLKDVEWGNGLAVYKRDNGLYYTYFQTSLGVQF